MGDNVLPDDVQQYLLKAQQRLDEQVKLERLQKMREEERYTLSVPWHFPSVSKKAVEEVKQEKKAKKKPAKVEDDDCECRMKKFNFTSHERWCPDFVSFRDQVAMATKVEIERQNPAHGYRTKGDQRA